MFIRGMIEFIKEIGKDDVCTKISLKIRKFWPGDEKINRKRKFRAAFDYYKCRSNQSNTRSSSQDRHDFLDDSKVKRQDIRENVQQRNYPVYTDLFEDYTAHIPKLSTDLFNMAYKRHKMGQLHKWIFPLMNTVCKGRDPSTKILETIKCY